VNTWDLVRRGLGERAVTKPETRAAALRHLLDVVLESAGIVDPREATRWFALEVAEPANIRTALESATSAVPLSVSGHDWFIWQGFAATTRRTGAVAAVQRVGA
jgi:uncharacterized protein YcaQ